MPDRTPRIAVALRGAALFAAGLALLVVIVQRSGVEQVRGVLAAADPALVAGALAIFVTQGLTVGLRWWVALRLCGHEARFASLLRATSATNLINFLAPGHFGEPIAATWLGRSGRAPGVEAFSLLVATKAVATTLNLVILIACLPLLLAGTASAGAVRQAGLIAGAAALLTGLAFGAVLHPGVAAWGARLAATITRLILSPLDRGTGRAERVARRVAVLFERFRTSFVVLARSPAALAAVVGLALVKVALLVVSMALVYAALGHPLGPAGATFIMSLDGVANLASIWVPGNLGVQELVHASAASGGLGVPQATAVSASLVIKAMMVVHAAVGALVWIGLAPLDRV